MTTHHLTGKNQTRRLHTASVIIILLLCLLAAECFLLFRLSRVPAYRKTESAIPSDPDPVSAFLRHYRGVPPEDSALEPFFSALDDISGNYSSGALTAEQAAAEISKMQALGSELLTKECDLCLKEINQKDDSRKTLAKADSLSETHNTADAIRMYRQVSEADAESYAAAQKALAEAETLYRQEMLAKADTLHQQEPPDYDGEIECLKDALTVLERDRELTAALAKAESSLQDLRRHQAMQSARMSYDNGHPAEAFSALNQALSDYPDDTLLDFSFRNLRCRYLQETKESAEKMIQDGKAADVAGLLNEAESLFPDAAELAAIRELAAAAQPKLLSALETRAFKDFDAAKAECTDLKGNHYPANGNLYCSYSDALTGRKSSSGEFALDGKFRTLTLTAAPLDSFQADEPIILEILGDGKLLTSYPFDRSTGAFSIQADVTGVKWLKLRVYPLRTPDLRNAGIILADGKVSP
ncbi:MAG: hypothetical protein IJL32_07330 [Oscillospiraceae bacterium]|nr:hypothetical protein [Oscillospiraceae bacterium]